MSGESDLHPLEEIVKGEQEAINTFASEMPVIWELTNTLGTAAQVFIAIATRINNLTSAEFWRLIIWQNVYRYLFLSLRFIVSRELDSAYTLLRNATELTRDIACIKDDPEIAKQWLDSKLKNKRDIRFKFDDSDSQLEYVHKIYKVASNWGTHGHISIIQSGQFIGKADNSDEVALYKISNEGVFTALFLWLTAFCPIQLICIEQFFKTHPAEFGPPRAAFIDLYDTVGEVIKELNNQIKSNND